jgi:hypothetical protein
MQNYQAHSFWTFHEALKGQKTRRVEETAASRWGRYCAATRRGAVLWRQEGSRLGAEPPTGWAAAPVRLRRWRHRRQGRKGRGRRWMSSGAKAVRNGGAGHRSRGRRATSAERGAGARDCRLPTPSPCLSWSVLARCSARQNRTRTL